MRRLRSSILPAACGLLLAIGGATEAAEPMPPAAVKEAAAAAEPDGATRPLSGEIDARLAAELVEAREALDAAAQRVADADAVYSRMRHSNRPRGAAREEIVTERAQARSAWVEARDRYEALERRAREAGLEP